MFAAHPELQLRFIVFRTAAAAAAATAAAAAGTTIAGAAGVWGAEEP